MRERDLEETRRRYRERWEQFGRDPRTLGWNKGLQDVRFQGAIEGLRDEDYASVLDVGCGFGDFLAFLRARGWKGSYTGVDVVPELIAAASADHGADGKFACVDLSSRASPAPTKASLVLAIGVFNHKLPEGHLDFVTSMLEAMWEAATHVVVLDFLSSTADRPRDDLFYADPGAMLTLARRFSRRALIHHAYMPFEFQLKIWRDDAFTVDAPAFPPYLRRS